MVIANWLKTLADSVSRRNRRGGRAGNRQALHSRELLHCGAFVETLEVKALLSVTPELVADLSVGASGSLPGEFANVNGTLFFAAHDAVNYSNLNF